MTTETRLHLVDKVRAPSMFEPRPAGYVLKPIKTWVFPTHKAAKTFADAKHRQAKKPLTFLYVLRTAIKGPPGLDAPKTPFG